YRRGLAPGNVRPSRVAGALDLDRDASRARVSGAGIAPPHRKEHLMTPVPPQGRGATIPFGAWLAAMLACGGALIFFLFAGMNGHLGVPELVVCTICAFLLAGYILVIGYIYGDARRRGMNAVLWALLAFFAPSAIGIILYFILRSPLPIYCWKCGGAVFNGYP